MTGLATSAGFDAGWETDFLVSGDGALPLVTSFTATFAASGLFDSVFGVFGFAAACVPSGGCSDPVALGTAAFEGFAGVDGFLAGAFTMGLLWDSACC